jgi:ubiquinone/menaquinone biosynthesis C-methylase UbiE
VNIGDGGDLDRLTRWDLGGGGGDRAERLARAAGPMSEHEVLDRSM